MLIEPNSILYSYAITRDFGFAPNPFHGVCTLATCKPKIRKRANVGDWILGVGGSKLGTKAKKCILLMKVTDKMTFQEYWENPDYSIKKPLRNGSRVRMLGDNIYHKSETGQWEQEDSHHSLPDGSINIGNLNTDTSSDNVLISNFFLYFGSNPVPLDLISIGHVRIRDYKKTILDDSQSGRMLIESCVRNHAGNLNTVVSDPCQFKNSHKRVDQSTGKIS